MMLVRGAGYYAFQGDKKNRDREVHTVVWDGHGFIEIIVRQTLRPNLGTAGPMLIVRQRQIVVPFSVLLFSVLYGSSWIGV